MFWRGDEAPEERVGTSPADSAGPIEIEAGAARPATILRVAAELEARGGEILELFKEIPSPDGQVVLAIHLRRDTRDVFVEVETGAWDGPTIYEALHKAAAVRGSEHAGVELEVLSAHPVPREVEFLFGRSAAALLQLDLLAVNLERPEAAARLFRDVASRHWDVDLDYELGYLPLTEQLLMSALDGQEGGKPPVLDVLVQGLGCFVGETIRRSVTPPGSWQEAQEWSEGPVVEFREVVIDPIGKARAFLREGPEDSLVFYAAYVLEQIGLVSGEEVLATPPEEPRAQA